MGAMTISGLAATQGVGVETIRFYQRKGLLRVPDAAERARGIRHYDAADADRLGFIRMAQTAGFTLAQIAELLALDAGRDRRRAQALARGQIARIDGRIAELQAARQSLARLADECAAETEGPCPIIASFAGSRCH